MPPTSNPTYFVLSLLKTSLSWPVSCSFTGHILLNMFLADFKIQFLKDLSIETVKMATKTLILWSQVFHLLIY